MRTADAPRREPASPYTTPEFRALSSTLRELERHGRSRAWRQLAGAAVRRRAELWRGLHLLRRLPVVEVRVTSGAAAQAIAARHRRPTTRPARAILRIPGSVAEYLRGRSRQALRTNAARARAAGVTCGRVAPAEQDAMLDRFLQHNGWDHEDRRFLLHTFGVRPGDQTFHVAFDGDGEPVALAVLDVDVHAAQLVFLRAGGGPVASAARYALWVWIVETLVAARVEVLLVGSAVRLAPGLQYFQQRLGFEVAHMRLVRV